MADGAYAIAYGGEARGGSATNNKLIMNNVTADKANVLGGLVFVKSGDASGNAVTLTDVTFGEGTEIAGGYVNGVDGNADENTVTIAGDSKVSGNVYGGYADNGTASDNVINIQDNADISNAALYGDNGGEGTGNTLNIAEGWTGKTVGAAQNFNEINVGAGVEADFMQGLAADGEDLTVNAQDATITVEGSTADGLDAVVYAAEGATLTINTNNDLVITDTADSAVAIGATGGSAVTIDSTADMTINGAVQAEAVRPGGSTISLAGDDITITAKAAKPSETEGAVRNASIDATGKVTIDADGLCGVGAGPDKATMAQSVNSIKAKEIEITSTNAFGVYANNHSYHAVGTRVHSYLEAETIDITSKKDGIYASNGAVTEVVGFDTMNVTSEEQGIGSEFGVMTFTGGDMTVTSAEEGIRSKLGGDLVFDVDSLKVDAGLESILLTGKSVMDVDAQTVQLDGSIALEGNNYGSPELYITVDDSLAVTAGDGETCAIGAVGGSTVAIDGTADMTINGAVQAEAVRPGGSTISLSGDDITITAKAATPSETEGAVRNASIDATGKVTIEADGLCGVGAGPDKTTMAQSVNSIKAKEIEITSTNAFGVYANNHSYHAVGTRVHSYLEAETIDITSKKDGIYASNGAVTEVVGFDTMNVTSEEQGIGSEFGVMTFTGGDMTVTSAEEGIRSKLGGDLVFDVDSLKVDAGLESIKLTGKSIMDVEAQKVQLDGDITLEDNSYGSPELNITFNGDESYLNGNVTTSEGGVTNMTFNGGATWTTEGSADSNVTNLTMDGGIINQESTGEITIDNLTGEGNVVFAEGSGQVNVLAAEAGANLNLTMAGVDADSFNTTEDLNGLANMIDVAEDATANVTGNVHVDEGLLNGAIDMTVDYENVDGDELLNGVIKDVRQGTSTTVEATSGVAANAAVAWREEDATFSQRLGELRSSKEGQGVWARFVQGEFERGNNFETEYNMFQIGYDKAKGDWHYGLAVNHTEGDTTYAAGSGELSNTSLSAYGTWLGERGHYKDIVAKVGSISSDYSIDAAGQLTKGEYDTYGTSLSAEYGMKNDMGKGWFVTPLAKMTYMHIGGDSYTTNNGINVKHDAIDSLVARLGVELGKELGNKGAIYVKASALHDFCGDADTTLRLGGNSALLTDEIGGTWYEVGFGFNYKMSDATNLYADVIKTYGDEIRTPWQWNAGVRYSF